MEIENSYEQNCENANKLIKLCEEELKKKPAGITLLGVKNLDKHVLNLVMYACFQYTKQSLKCIPINTNSKVAEVMKAAGVPINNWCAPNCRSK